MLITPAFVDNFLPKKYKMEYFFCCFIFFPYLCVLKIITIAVFIYERGDFSGFYLS